MLGSKIVSLYLLIRKEEVEECDATNVEESNTADNTTKKYQKKRNDFLISKVSQYPFRE